MQAIQVRENMTYIVRMIMPLNFIGELALLGVSKALTWVRRMTSYPHEINMNALRYSVGVKLVTSKGPAGA